MLLSPFIKQGKHYWWWLLSSLVFVSDLFFSYKVLLSDRRGKEKCRAGRWSR